MSDKKSTLLLTRPKAQSESFWDTCEPRIGGSVRVLISPIVEIVPTQFDIDLDAYKTIVVTSGNAVEILSEKLDGRSVATVGQRTALRASEFGASSLCLGQDVAEFDSNLGKIEGPALHVRGVHSRGHLPETAHGLGLAFDECVVYEQSECRLSTDAKRALLQHGVIVPLFSPRSAALVSQVPTSAELIVLAISEGTAQAWRGEASVIVADNPTASSMLSLIEAVI